MKAYDTNIRNYIEKMITDLSIQIRRKINQPFYTEIDDRIVIKHLYDRRVEEEGDSSYDSSSDDSDDDTEVMEIEPNSDLEEKESIRYEFAPRENPNLRLRRVKKAINDTNFSLLVWITNQLRLPSRSQLVSIIRYLLSYHEIGEVSQLRELFIQNGLGWYFTGDLDNSTEEEEYTIRLVNSLNDAVQLYERPADNILTDAYVNTIINALDQLDTIVRRKVNEFVTSHSLVEAIYITDEWLSAYCLMNEAIPVERVTLLTKFLVVLYKSMLKQTFSDAYMNQRGVTNWVINPDIDNQEEMRTFYDDYQQRNE